MRKPEHKGNVKAAVTLGVASENLSLTDRATKTVRDHILDLTLAPGMTLDERNLLERFEFGRTPMREAMNRLIVEGLVVPRGVRGVQVAPLIVESTIELFDAYVLSERMVASVLDFDYPDLVEDIEQLHAQYLQNLDRTKLLQVTELNALFHGKLAAATRNAYIEAYSYKLHNLARRLSYFIYKREADAESETTTVLFEKPRNDHEKIINTIKNSNRDELVKLLTNHAIFFRTRLARIISEDHSAEIDFTTVTENA